MGPFNRVADEKISDADEVYRQHDLGYARERAAGRNPYISWNRYDDALMRSPNYGWPDYLAKGFFGIKSVLTGAAFDRNVARFSSGSPSYVPPAPRTGRATYIPRRGKIRSRVRYEQY